MNRLLFLITIISAISIQSCYYDVENELYPGNCDLSTVTYQETINPIIVTNCIGCHSASAAQGEVILEGYEALAGYLDDGSFACSINWSSGCSPMPKNQSKLSDCDLATINKWIDNGALND